MSEPEDTKPETESRCAPAPCYPPIEECIRAIAAKAGAPVNVVAAALLAQSQEMNMSAEELVHTQYRTATGQSGFDPDVLKADNGIEQTRGKDL